MVVRLETDCLLGRPTFLGRELNARLWCDRHALRTERRGRYLTPMSPR